VPSLSCQTTFPLQPSSNKSMAFVTTLLRTFQIAGPFGLHMTFRTKVPGTLWFRYPIVSTPDSPLTGRAAQGLSTESPVEGTSAQSSTDQDAMNIDTQIYLDIGPVDDVSTRIILSAHSSETIQT
jgi:hypothetical protein